MRMQTFLILSKNEDEAKKLINEKCSAELIHELDKSYFSLQFDKKKGESASSFTIENVREIQKKIFLRPLKGQKKAIIILHAHLLTIPAQNALLKTLEEPPQDTLIFLVSESLDVLLPTILSRCFQISLTKDAEERSPLPSDELTKWKNLKTSSALKLAEVLSKDSKKTIVLLEQTISLLRDELLIKIQNSQNKEWEHGALVQLIKTHKTLTRTNTNVRLCLENLFLSLKTHP